MAFLDGHFYVDEYSLDMGIVDANEAWRVLSYFAETITEAHENHGRVFYAEKIWDMQPIHGVPLANFLYSPDSAAHDAALLIGIGLDRSEILHELLDPNLCGNHLQDPGKSVGSRYCSLSIEEGYASAMLSADLSDKEHPGDLNVLDEAEVSSLQVISRVDQFAIFWRSSFIDFNFTLSDIEAIAHRAFPGLDFVEGVWSGAKDFDGSFDDIRASFISILGGLSDHMYSVLCESNDANWIHTRMKSLAGVNCSRESNRTRNNSGAMRQRNRDFAGQAVVFEWHAKIQPHKNRIHFASVGGRIVIGIFCDHLPV